MRYLGRLTEWHDDKGYGFVVPNGGGDRAFVHIKAFERQGRRPVIGDLVSYVVKREARGRFNAVQLRFAGTTPHASPMPRRAFPRKGLALLAFAALVVAAAMRALPWPVVGLYGGMSVLLFVMYAFDKGAAERGGWRTRESTLHFFAAFGGWPGALLAQDRYRHKTRKASFQWLFWFTVLANCAALALCLNA